MLRSIKEMTGYAVRATDGEIGRVADFYFDDDRWTVRYVMVNTGEAGALPSGALTPEVLAAGRTVLISPMAVTNPDFDGKRFDVALTREQVLNSPSLGSGQAVSPEWEEEYAEHHRLPRYWGGTGLWGAFANAVDAAAAPLAGFPLTPAQTGAAADATPDAGTVTTVDARSGTTAAPETGATEDASVGATGDAGAAARAERHLRRASEFVGYGVEASDGSAGAVADMLVDDRSWQVLHLVVDTTRWLPGGEVMAPADMVTQVDWTARRVTFGQTREEIRRRAEFRPAGQGPTLQA